MFIPTGRAARLVAACATLVATLALAACDFDAPITDTGTGPVDARLLGDWTAVADGVAMKVRSLDDRTYVVVCDGDLYRVHHSDVAGTAFLSVQELETSGRTFSYLTWALSDEGQVLTLRVVNAEVMPEHIPDSATARKALTAHIGDARLLGKDLVFRRAKA